MATMTPLGGVPHLIKDLKEAIGNENVSTDESELRRFNNSKNPLFAGRILNISCNNGLLIRLARCTTCSGGSCPLDR